MSTSMTPGFFSPAKLARKSTQAKTPRPQLEEAGWVSVGNHSLFRAVALGLLDKAFTHPQAYNEIIRGVLTKTAIGGVLEGQKAASECLKQLYYKLAQEELLAKLTAALHLIAVDHLARQMSIYGPFLIINDHLRTSDDLRDPDTRLGRVGLAALASALHLPIKILIVEAEKPLHATLRLPNDEICHSLPPIKIRVDDNELFQVFMGHTSVFHNERLRLIPKSTQPSVSPLLMGELAPSLHEIKNNIIHDYIEHYQFLLEKYEKKLLTSKLLLEIFTHESCKQNSRYFGFEFGTASLFNRCSEQLSFLADERTNSDQQRIKALAQGMSLGIYEPEKIAAYLEGAEEANDNISSSTPKL